MPTDRRRKADELRKQQTKLALLDAARRVFVEKGYHPTLISDIVQEAGMGQGSFYRHFSNKREAFECLFNDFIDSLFEEFADFTAHLPRNAAEYDRLSRESVGKVARILHEQSELTTLFLRQAPVIDRAFEERFNDSLAAFAALAQSFLDHAISKGFSRPCDSNIVAHCLVGAAKHVLSVKLGAHVPQSEVERIVGEAIDFAFLGIGPPNSRS